MKEFYMNIFRIIFVAFVLYTCGKLSNYKLSTTDKFLKEAISNSDEMMTRDAIAYNAAILKYYHKARIFTNNRVKTIDKFKRKYLKVLELINYQYEE